MVRIKVLCNDCLLSLLEAMFEPRGSQEKEEQVKRGHFITWAKDLKCELWLARE